MFEKGQFHYEKAEKNYNTMTYPPSSCLITPMLNIKNNHVLMIFLAPIICKTVNLYYIFIICTYGKISSP